MSFIHLILQIAAIVGIIAFGWSVSSSLESIARDLRRLADSRDPLGTSTPELRETSPEPPKTV